MNNMVSSETIVERKQYPQSQELSNLQTQCQVILGIDFYNADEETGFTIIQAESCQ